MRRPKECAAFFAAGLFSLLLPLSAAAQLPPQGFTADPSNPQIANWKTTHTGGGKTYTISRRYYYDCLKAKWVLVAHEGNTPGFTPDKLGSTGESGPPPGSERSLSEPDHAFNPTSGENYHYDGDKKEWVNSKTGKVFPVVNLCPPPETGTATPPPPPPPTPPPRPKPEKTGNTGGLLGDILGHTTIGIGIGGGGNNDRHRGHEHSDKPPSTDTPPSSNETTPPPHD